MPLRASAILFDLDGVLADSTPSVTRAWSAWARRVGLDPDALLPQVHGRRAIDTIRAVRPELDAESELATLVADETSDNADVVVIPDSPLTALAKMPDRLLPVAMLRNHPPMAKPTRRLGASLVTIESPIGDRHSSPSAWMM